MKINLKYFNKKIIAGLMAGTMALSLTGCGEPKYKEISTGVYEMDGTISFNDLKGYFLLEIESNDKDDLYLAYKENLNSNGSKSTFPSIRYSEYINVFDQTVLYTEYFHSDKKDRVQNENNLLNIDGNIEDYLVKFNVLQDSYTKEDLEMILNKIKEEWQYTENIEEAINKQKVKE